MSDDSHRKRVSIQLSVPAITKAGRQKAAEIANAPVVMDTPDGPVSIMAHDVTEDDIRRDAQRIVGLPDDEKEDAVFKLLDSCMQLVRDSQELARNYLWLADQLDETAHQIAKVEQIVVTRLRRDPEDE